MVYDCSLCRRPAGSSESANAATTRRASGHRHAGPPGAPSRVPDAAAPPVTPSRTRHLGPVPVALASLALAPTGTGGTTGMPGSPRVTGKLILCHCQRLVGVLLVLVQLEVQLEVEPLTGIQVGIMQLVAASARASASSTSQISSTTLRRTLLNLMCIKELL